MRTGVARWVLAAWVAGLAVTILAGRSARGDEPPPEAWTDSDWTYLGELVFTTQIRASGRHLFPHQRYVEGPHSYRERSFRDESAVQYHGSQTYKVFRYRPHGDPDDSLIYMYDSPETGTATVSGSGAEDWVYVDGEGVGGMRRGHWSHQTGNGRVVSDNSVYVTHIGVRNTPTQPPAASAPARGGPDLHHYRVRLWMVFPRDLVRSTGDYRTWDRNRARMDAEGTSPPVTGKWYSAGGGWTATNTSFPSTGWNWPAVSSSPDPVLEGELDFSRPSFIVRSRHFHHEERYELSGYPDGSPGHGVSSGRVDADYTIAFNVKPEPVELDLIPQEGFERWMPTSSGRGDFAGNGVWVRLDLHKPGQPGVRPGIQATFRAELVSTSREPGYCLNGPRYAGQSGGGTDEPYDLRIARGTPDFEVAEDGQSATTQEYAQEGDLLIRSHDYGGYTTLRVTAYTEDGQIVVGQARIGQRPPAPDLEIPLDENDNHVADAYERKWDLFDRNLPAEADFAPAPSGQHCDGDGISLYEKYRGFVQGYGTWDQLDPWHKYLFVYDPYDVALEAAGMFEAATGLRLVFVPEGRWSGPGLAAHGRRIVNYNHGTGHWTDQHALHVVLDNSVDEGLLWRGWEAGHGPSWPDPSAEEPAPQEDGPPAAVAEPPDPSVLDAMLAQLERLIEAANAQGGSPASVDQVILHPAVTESLVYWQAVEAMREHPEFAARYQRWARTKPPEEAADLAAAELLGEYDAQHPQARELALLLRRRLSIMRGLCRGVGVLPHTGPAEGDLECVIRRMSTQDAPLTAEDPYWLGRYNPWPHRLCRQALHTPGNRGCWGSVQVTDRPQ